MPELPDVELFKRYVDATSLHRDEFVHSSGRMLAAAALRNDRTRSSCAMIMREASGPGESSSPTAVRARRGSPDRVVAFSDGVFAIIITILVLDVDVPSNLPEQSLREALEASGTTLVAWVISFLLVGMYWVWHRDQFAVVRHVNRDVVWINLLFLLPVSLIPFAATVLGEYWSDPRLTDTYCEARVAMSLGATCPG